MKGFRGFPRRRGLPGLDALVRQRPERSPGLPTRALTPTKGGQPRTTFQRRIDVTSRGPSQPVAGLSPNEQRAAQDIDAPLPIRIIVKALRDRMELFEVSLPNQAPVSVAGITVDFLVTSRVPPFAFDLKTRRRLDDGFRKAALELAGYHYDTVDQEAVLRSAEETERELDRVLAPTVYGAGGVPQVLSQPPYEVLERPDLPGALRVWPPVLDYGWTLGYEDVLRIG